jgi:GGDEF domain-containing protein
MQSPLIFDSALSADELRGFTRTVAEIEWLLLILVMLYQVVLAPDEESSAALMMAMSFFAAFVLAFHYANFYRQETPWKIALETWVMIAFITWVLAYTGGIESPLLDLYILVVIVSALTLGKIATLLEMGLITGCYIWLGRPAQGEEILALPFGTKLLAQISPMLLVAYITTMLSSDIRVAYGHTYGQLKVLSETDELTGVMNMRGLAVAADQIFRQAERYARSFSVIMIDSDSKNPMRPPDIVARYGGDEFLVLLPETPCSNAAGVAERIRRGMESTPISGRGQTITATVSIGLACYPTHGPDFEAVLEKADQAMYASKAGGKNRITVVSA